MSIGIQWEREDFCPPAPIAEGSTFLIRKNKPRQPGNYMEVAMFRKRYEIHAVYDNNVLPPLPVAWKFFTLGSAQKECYMMNLTRMRKAGRGWKYKVYNNKTGEYLTR